MKNHFFKEVKYSYRASKHTLNPNEYCTIRDSIKNSQQKKFPNVIHFSRHATSNPK